MARAWALCSSDPSDSDGAHVSFVRGVHFSQAINAIESGHRRAVPPRKTHWNPREPKDEIARPQRENSSNLKKGSEPSVSRKTKKFETCSRQTTVPRNEQRACATASQTAVLYIETSLRGRGRHPPSVSDGDIQLRAYSLRVQPGRCVHEGYSRYPAKFVWLWRALSTMVGIQVSLFLGWDIP